MKPLQTRLTKLGLLAIAVALIAAPAAADEKDGWKNYQQRLENRRERLARRLDEWRKDREQRYGRYRGGGPQGRPLPEGSRFELEHSYVEPGRYDVELPFGSFRVEVPRRQPGPGPGIGSWGDLQSLAANISDRLRDVHIVLQRRGETQQFQPEVNYARETIDALKELLDDGADPRRVSEQFEAFDRHWHELAHRLESHYDPRSTIGRYVADLQRRHEVFHQVLQVAPEAVYDRVRVAALARHLARATGSLLEGVEFESRFSPAARGVWREARRAYRAAEDLADSVRENAPFRLVLADYEHFHDAWHRLVERSQRVPALSRRLHEDARQIWQIDYELKHELQIQPPTVGDDRRLLHRAEAVAVTANHLLFDLQAVLGQDERHTILQDSRRFAQAADALVHALRSPGRPDSARTAAAELQQEWRHFTSQLRGLDRRMFTHALRVAERLREDMARLAVVADGSYRGFRP